MTPAPSFSPGSLVYARGREWIVLSSSDPDTLLIRPLTGSEEDQTLLHLDLEAEAVREAAFAPPSARDKQASHDGALLLRDALLLSLRRGAGPFRGFGQIAVEPRAYQLVPLLMALRLDPVRLLIADDVGVGKTIEAALIARELLDRGDIQRTAVLCPPHLVDQWVTELEDRFHVRAVPVTAAGASRLERDLPPSESIFTAHPHTVVSLDYIKNERRRIEFVRTCPEFIIVDEAHSCAGGRGTHRRYELLRALADSPSRHLVLLTATPHSGDEAAFYKLLGLLRPEFAGLPEASEDERRRLRERLAQHFVQRRRPDIAEWQTASAADPLNPEERLFPRRETKELTYRLGGAWESFFDEVLNYCAARVQRAEGGPRERLNFWTTLALMRCAASSPAAAVQALYNQAGLADQNAADFEVRLRERVLDGTDDQLAEDDAEPPAALASDPALAALITRAEGLRGQAGDPKLKLLTEHLSQLLAEGFSPVVFCRYLATAEYLAARLSKPLRDVTIAAVTGLLPAEERKAKVAELGQAERRLLIATDCLSEGINLQEHFDAVVHYDLSWNPTRHEQREGRVDRFGQRRPVVRATLLYGANNPVDGAVLEVILRKAEKIREELGVPVPLPDEGHTLTGALLRAVFLRQKQGNKQRQLDFGQSFEAQALDDAWQDAAEKAKRSRTVFAQRRLKPDEVLPEWNKTLGAVGGRAAVQRFTARALSRLGSGLTPLDPRSPHKGHQAALSALPPEVQERLEAEGLSDSLRLDFHYPPAARCLAIGRSHPLVAVLAETLLGRSLAPAPAEDDGAADPAVVGRVGAWESAAVTTRTVVVLLRLRHQLLSGRARRDSQVLLVEEATALSFRGAAGTPGPEGDEALALLDPPPAGDLPKSVRERELGKALELVKARAAELRGFAERRAQALLADHRRVREAAQAPSSSLAAGVKALLPPDVLGVYVLLPPAPKDLDLFGGAL